MKKALILSLGAVLLTGVSAQAFAQATASAPAVSAPPAPPTFGAAIPGQCVLDTQQAMVDSNMGKAAADRLRQLKAVVDSELSTEGKALDDERQSLASQQKAATTPAAKTTWEGKAKAWEQKRQAFQEKIDQRNQEMQYTQQEVMSAIFQKMIPQVNAVVSQRSCATVISADSLLHYDLTANTNGQPSQTSFLYANPAMNITKDVVAKLDATKELLPQFDRVSLDQPAQGGAPNKK